MEVTLFTFQCKKGTCVHVLCFLFSPLEMPPCACARNTAVFYLRAKYCTTKPRKLFVALFLVTELEKNLGAESRGRLVRDLLYTQQKPLACIRLLIYNVVNCSAHYQVIADYL